MRTDPGKDQQFVFSDHWAADLDLNAFRPRDPADPEQGSIVRSFSGQERNRLFIQSDNNFDDVTLVSGSDSRNDSRGFVLLDFDRDGWLDLGITSPLNPRFQILRNQIGNLPTEIANRAVFIALEGGHQGTGGQSDWSSRDPIGATVLVTTGQKKRKFQLSCGEGLAAQNSKWIHVGMGDISQIDRLDVTWPSGKQTTYDNVPAGSRVTLVEDGTIRLE